jgi:hypothetical protein
MSTTKPDGTDDSGPAGVVFCDHCGQEHDAWPAHADRFNGAQLYAVVCPVDGLTDYYTAERFIR